MLFSFKHAHRIGKQLLALSNLLMKKSTQLSYVSKRLRFEVKQLSLLRSLINNLIRFLTLLSNSHMSIALSLRITPR